MDRLCDECGAKRVSEGKSRPTSQIWGPNGTRWIKCQCVHCKKENQDCALYDVGACSTNQLTTLPKRDSMGPVADQQGRTCRDDSNPANMGLGRVV